MGVNGLWKLIEPSGRVVPLEKMANKVLAVDVSIWLHQALKGMQDVHGAPVAVAHLLILFHRLCKLLFYKIKPVFVFDGGVPVLKRSTMAARRQQKTAARGEAVKVREKLLKNLLKHEAVRQVLSSEAATAVLGLSSLTSLALPGPAEEEDLYKLPPIASQSVDSNSSEDASSSDSEGETHLDVHSIDVRSDAFRSLPAEVRHDILSDLKDTRKQNSWRHLDDMPKDSGDFSSYQMNRLLKRRAFQVSLDEAGKEMGGKPMSLQELEDLLGAQGVPLAELGMEGRRIAQDSVTRFMLVRNTAETPATKTETAEAPLHPEQPGKQEPTQSFDIDQHLKDVQWSSDSDGEIKQEPELSQEQIYDLVKKKDIIEKKLLKFHERKDRARTSEVHEILSVLEDEPMEISVAKQETDVIEASGTEHDFQESKKEEITMDISVANQETHFTESPESRERTISEASKRGETTEGASMGDVSEILSELEDKPPERSVQIESSVTERAQTSEADIISVLEDEPASVRTELDQVTNELEHKTEKEPRSIEFILDPTKVVKDDIFKDVFVTGVSSPEPVQVASKGIEITLDPAKSVDTEDDIFKDVFSEDKHEAECAPSRSSDTTKVSGGIEIVLDPKLAVSGEEDMFKDVFSGTGATSGNAGVEDSPEEAADESDEGEEEEGGEGGAVEGAGQPTAAPMTDEDLLAMQRSLESEQSALLAEEGKQTRQALGVTDQMCQDAQELLRMFGVPFVVAPMEAEAQCAILDLLGLTEGTITDDSDIWLFGGRTVYKNFFNQKKHVLEYRAEDIHQYFKLSRSDLIKLALLVGSDYTQGLNAVGPVTALEILAAFPSPVGASSQAQVLGGLERFRDWLAGGCASGPPRAALRRKMKNTTLIPGFPSSAVVDAYLHPEVDDSREPFSWAKPNVMLLQGYTKLKFGWSPAKCNELVMPVMKKLLEATDQTTIDRFFRAVPQPALGEGTLSKRVVQAVKRLGRGHSPSDSDSDPGPEKKPRQSRVAASSAPPASHVPPVPSTSKLNVDHLKAKLHKVIKIPQKERTRELLEERRKKAAELFKSGKRQPKRKAPAVKKLVNKELKLSESSSEGD